MFHRGYHHWWWRVLRQFDAVDSEHLFATGQPSAYYPIETCIASQRWLNVIYWSSNWGFGLPFSAPSAGSAQLAGPAFPEVFHHHRLPLADHSYTRYLRTYCLLHPCVYPKHCPHLRELCHEFVASNHSSALSYSGCSYALNDHRDSYHCRSVQFEASSAASLLICPLLV